ncbi:MAG: hypothetical protein Q9200_007337 [Gallowayella weberi]
MGESYAGIYIPYFAKALMSNRNILNINLKAIALGDPTIGNNAAMTDLVTTTYLHQISTYYKIPKPILSAFDAADRRCGFDKLMHQLTYPPTGKLTINGNPEGLNFLKQRKEPLKRKRQTPCLDDVLTPHPPKTPPTLPPSTTTTSARQSAAQPTPPPSPTSPQSTPASTPTTSTPPATKTTTTVPQPQQPGSTTPPSAPPSTRPRRNTSKSATRRCSRR